MLTVPVPSRSLGDYAAVVGQRAIATLRDQAERFRGARVLHVSSTAFGGGVAELLYTEVALMRDLGLDVEWRLLSGHEEFFGVTKQMHNALQGATVPWGPDSEELHTAVNDQNAERLSERYDYVIVHDPQPAGLLHALRAKGDVQGKWIWRCHIDLTERFEPVWSYLAPLVDEFDATIFTMEDFVPPSLAPKLALIPPAIDPLSLKNVPLDDEIVAGVVAMYDVDPGRPIAVQVSRFDPWKDPLGVIDAYRIAREQVPGLQLVMIASMAHDDPEGMHYYTLTDYHRDGDPDIKLLSNLNEVGALAVNAFQRAADVLIQKSLREGFGLTVSEGMWKRKPVVAGNVGGIKLQIDDGVSGYLVASIEECADRMIRCLTDRDAAVHMGAAARERVRERFLVTRKIGDFLALFEELS